MKRSSSRARSCGSDSTRSRAAASSMASGTPSSRRHSRTTSATFAAVSSKSPVAARARSTNSETASNAVASGTRRRVDLRHGHRRHRQQVLAVHRQRLPAGREHRQVLGAAQQLGDERRARVDEVLAVVQDQQQPVPAHRHHEVVDLPLGEPVVQAVRLRDRARHQRRLGPAGQLDHRDAAVVPGRQVAGDPQGEPGLADAAGAGQRDQPCVREQVDDLAELPATTDEAGELGRERGMDTGVGAHLSLPFGVDRVRRPGRAARRRGHGSAAASSR